MNAYSVGQRPGWGGLAAISGWLARIACATAFVAAGAAVAQTTNTIEQVSVTRAASGNTIVRFQLKAPPANPPAGFATVTPPRIALDFFDTTSALQSNQRSVDDPALRSLQFVEAGRRTRVVFQLNKAQAFDTRVEGNAVIVTLSDSATAAVAQASPPPPQRFAEPGSASQQHSLRDVDFRRGKNGEGRIIVDLSDNNTGIDIRQQGRQLIVDFQRTTVPKNLERRLDVADFNTPVVTVDTFPVDGNARMVITPQGLWEHSAYQAENRFIVEVKPIVDDPNKLVQGTRAGYKGEKLSLNFQNIEVRSVLQVIADFTGLNIVTSDTVTGSLTLRLKDVPWDQALDIILQTKGLDMRKNGNVVLIAPREELALKEKQQLESQAQINDLEPLRTEAFQLNYARAEKVKALIEAKGSSDTRILSKRGSIFIDERTNKVFVTDIADRLEEVRRVLQQIDTAVRQVLIEARIVIADDTFSRSLGVRLGQQTGATIFGGRYAVGSAGSLQPIADTTTGTAAVTSPTPFQIASGQLRPQGSDLGNLNVNLPAIVASGTPASLALTLINLGSGNLLNLELQALEADNRGKVVSSPRVITADNQKAVITQGTQIPYSTASANTGTNIQFKDALLKLEVTPQITPDNRVIMSVDIHKDSVGQQIPQATGGFQPAIDTKTVTTQVAVNNGDTAVIGGIYEENITNTISKVPFLGDIPVAGNLFKSTLRSAEKTELLIFLTPRIVKETITSVR
ncbi:MAG TPA: type IV pilus secretin PilQ family protein [Casimicrobiaceae bacterium]|nr:type IV pilus secretin PilQ family protein [Casimicrobiaceae bacterium]